MVIKYVSKDTTPLYAEATGNKKIIELLWGDQVKILSEEMSRSKVSARGKIGYVNNSALNDESLLEFYFIDVGQGDGILIRTPDGRHIMIDGGLKRDSQPTGKNAADFVDWKFAKDYGLKQIHLNAVIASHNDADHYGGLSDLLNVDKNEELDAKDIYVDSFYHAGVAWWINPENGVRWLGSMSEDKKYLVQLMGEREEIIEQLDDGANPRLQGDWAEFVRHVTEAKTIDGVETPIKRLSDLDRFLPGFDGSDGGVCIRVLAPVETNLNGKRALYAYGSSSENTNGNSLLLRFDYKRSRILMTGDLNRNSQQLLLDHYIGNRLDFQCDVAKACHHGSDEISYEFLSVLHPAVTVISSGDNEGYNHPRPSIVAASATTGYMEISNDKIVTPLVYSTELARSIDLGKPSRLILSDQTGNITVDKDHLDEITIDVKVVKAGNVNPSTKTKKLDKTYIVTGLIYGLVNVRTNGEKILCATLNEKSYTWDIKTFTSRF